MGSRQIAVRIDPELDRWVEQVAMRTQERLTKREVIERAVRAYRFWFEHTYTSTEESAE